VKKSVVLMCALSATVFAAEQPLRQAQGRPNIIVIMADDLGYADIGCYGCKDIPTPHIDQIAAEGVRFTSGYVTAPMCGPSRAGFLTGRIQSTFGYYKNVSQPLDPAEGLPKMETIASLLQKQGYVTGGVGKWHMGTAEDQHPCAMGFDDWFGFLGGGHTYYPLDHPSYHGRFTPIKRPANARTMQHTLPILHNETPVQWEQYLTRELTDQGIAFVKKNQDKPFFLFMAYNAPHEELEAPDESIAKFPAESMTPIPGVKPAARSVYGAMVYEMDEGVGRLLATVNELGLTEKTVVWFLSDNGGMKKTSDNRPLKGAKWDSWEGGLRVPLIVKWPGNSPAGVVLDESVTSLDIGATALAMAGGDPADSGLDGKDIRPYMTAHSSDAPHDLLFWRTGSYAAPGGVLRGGDYKLIFEKGKTQLYNLKDDLGETTDLAASQPERVQTMLSQWKEWDRASNKPELWTPGKDKNAFQYADYEWLKGSPHYKAKSVSSVSPAPSASRPAANKKETTPSVQVAFKNAVECQDLSVISAPDHIEMRPQDLKKYTGVWNADNQILFKGAVVGDGVELRIPTTSATAEKLVLHATKAPSYGILHFTVNGQPAGVDVDLYAVQPTSSGPVELGTFTPGKGAYLLRIEVVGKNPKSSRAAFGIDCVTRSAAE
jgi:arylsulfatase A-like enzyme